MKLKRVATGLGVALLAGCASGSGYSAHDGHAGRAYDDRYEDGYDERDARCDDCGRVERIERHRGDGHASGAGALTGALTGAVVGGALGNQVGSGSGRTAATVAGAVLGGVAGNAIEEDARAGARYDVFVRLQDGRRLIVTQRELAGVREGSYVRIVGGRVRLM